MNIYINCVREDKPDTKWKSLFEKSWIYYKKWFIQEGIQVRAGYLTSYKNLKSYMPELVPIYDKLVELAGGSDLAARFLSLYNPPAYLSACSQVVWTKDNLSLIRNYDYSPYYFEGVLLYSHWLKPVIAMSDCNWGALDGINQNGLSVSLTFGGSKNVGSGFGIPLVLRYILEIAETVAEALQVLKRVPVHMAYNITLLDCKGDYATVFVSPGQESLVTRQPIATNHQAVITWEAYADLTGTLEREKFLYACLADLYESEQALIQKFFQAPLYSTRFDKGFGTLYTAVYHPLDNTARYIWKNKEISQSFRDFKEKKIAVNLQTGKSGKSLI